MSPSPYDPLDPYQRHDRMLEEVKRIEFKRQDERWDRERLVAKGERDRIADTLHVPTGGLPDAREEFAQQVRSARHAAIRAITDCPGLPDEHRSTWIRMCSEATPDQAGEDMTRRLFDLVSEYLYEFGFERGREDLQYGLIEIEDRVSDFTIAIAMHHTYIAAKRSSDRQ